MNVVWSLHSVAPAVGAYRCLAAVLAMVAVGIAPMAAAGGPLCESVKPRAVELTCRGGGGMSFSAPADVDLTLIVRLSRDEAGGDSLRLAPATCRSATPLVAGDGPQRLVVPLGGPLVAASNPIGHHAAICARDATCVMTVCAYVADGELRAVDGVFNVSFW